jgi:hypothetical protein
MKTHHGRSVVVAIVLALGACTSGPEATDTPTASPEASSEPSSAPAVQDVMELEEFAPLEPGTYSIDPDTDPSTPLRVMYEVPAKGWSSWPGAAKLLDAHLAVSITTVTNLVRHGCSDHAPADPPVGSSVDDLATALADLAPFEVASPPRDVTIYGYSGKHLQLTVPNLPVTSDDFDGCVAGRLASWIAPTMGPSGEDAFYGYGGPGRIEEFWILDVDGTRLVVEATWTPDSPRKNVAEMRAILDSIKIEP